MNRNRKKKYLGIQNLIFKKVEKNTLDTVLFCLQPKWLIISFQTLIMHMYNNYITVQILPNGTMV